MNRLILFMLSAFFILLLSGCAQKVVVRALEPAQVERAANTKKISVSEFKNDSVGLSGKIEANLAHTVIDGKNYFTLVSRDDFKKIINEQKLQNSGLVETSTAVEVGHLIGADAIISGTVIRPTYQDTRYRESRLRCANKKCDKFEEYSVWCVKRVVGLSATLKMVDVTQGDIIYADTLSQNRSYRHCRDDSRALPSVTMAAQSLADTIAGEFTSKLSPHYRYFDVELLDNPDLDYSSEQKRLLEVSLSYIKQSRYDKAEQFLGELIDSTGSKSYVAFYNLGVVKEAEGKYKEAQEYYNRADSLMIEPVEEINRAVLRIRSLIIKQKKMLEQLKKG